jgi:integrase/recombinase XerC
MDYKEAFLSYLKFEKRYSVHTTKAYQKDLEQFEEYCLTRQSDLFPPVDYRVIRGWMAHLSAGKVSSRSMNRKLSTLKSFYRFLLKQGYVDYSPMGKIISPKISRKLPVFIEQEHMVSLLEGNNFGDDYAGRRNQLIIDLLYCTGIRVSELVNLKVHDVNLASSTIRVLGKRNKERIIPLVKEVAVSLKAYLNDFREIIGADSDSLFITGRGKQIYARFVYRIVRDYVGLVSTVEKRSPHILRHSFATHMLNNGADLNAIKELLGHANLSATQVYTHNSFEKLKKIYKQAHPRA